jgi:PAS domain S-box-containing protein
VAKSATRLNLLVENRIARYLLAIAAVAVAFALRLAFIPLLAGTRAPFGFFFAAVMATSVSGGVGPGVLALLLSLPIGAAFVMRAGYPLSHAAIQSLLFTVEGLVVIYFTFLVRQGREAAREANRQLRRANEEIRRAEAHTHELLELAPDAFFQSDLSGRFTDVNQAACRLLGYSRDELMSKTIFDVIPEEDASRLEAVREKLLVPGRAERAEWIHKRKDGTFVPLEVSANILPDGRWQAFARDISERKRIEDERQVFVSFLENSSDFIGVADPDGKPIYVNPAGRRLVGLPAHHPVETTQMLEYYPPDQRAFASDVIVRSMFEQGRWEGETYFRHWQTQDAIPVSDAHFLIRDPRTGRILGTGTITRDISMARRITTEREELLARERLAREQAESANERLRESEERFRLTIDEAPIGMARVALDGRFVRVNHALCEIVGYSPDELTALTFQAITHPDYRDADVAAARQLARGEIPSYKVEKQYVRKDGSTVDVQLSVSVLRSRDGAALSYVSQIEDITDRKRAEKALRRAVTSREQVLRIVAHDLRNPLTTIMQSAALAQRGSEPERLNKRLDIISRAAVRMDHLIQDLLDVSLIEAGQLQIEADRLSASDLVHDAVDMQTPLASSSGLDIRVDVPHDGDVLWANRERLHEVFENLIGNAIKFTEAGGHITVGATSRDGDVLFSVADTGCGIAVENLPQVFDPFWQAVPKAGNLGAGLGLPITKGIVEAHGGRIWVESSVGHGSTFFFTIPKAPPDADHAIAADPRLKA